MAGDPAYDSHLLCEKFCEGHEGERCLALSPALFFLYQHQLPFPKPVPSTALLLAAFGPQSRGRQSSNR